MAIGCEIFFGIRKLLVEIVFPTEEEKDVATKKDELGSKIFNTMAVIDIIALVGCLIVGTLLATHVVHFDASPWHFFGPAIAIPALIIAGIFKNFLNQKCCSRGPLNTRLD